MSAPSGEARPGAGDEQHLHLVVGRQLTRASPGSASPHPARRHKRVPLLPPGRPPSLATTHPARPGAPAHPRPRRSTNPAPPRRPPPRPASHPPFVAPRPYVERPATYGIWCTKVGLEEPPGPRWAAPARAGGLWPGSRLWVWAGSGGGAPWRGDLAPGHPEEIDGDRHFVHQVRTSKAHQRTDLVHKVGLRSRPAPPAWGACRRPRARPAPAGLGRTGAVTARTGSREANHSRRCGRLSV